ncbi:MAG: NYN domain-containing protein [Candidatus Schekmanbacteria bacterium]|nr:NYN domain-containing protein [Candidatus Schekmanbacteria bacterium]
MLASKLSHRELVNIVNRTNISFNGMRTHSIPSEELVGALGRDFFRDAETAWPIIKALVKKNQPLIEQVEQSSAPDLRMTSVEIEAMFREGRLGPLLWALAVDRREDVQSIARAICDSLESLIEVEVSQPEPEPIAMENETDDSNLSRAFPDLPRNRAEARPAPRREGEPEDDFDLDEIDSEETVVLSVRNLTQWADDLDDELEPETGSETEELRSKLVQQESALLRVRSELSSSQRRLKRAQEQLADLEAASGQLRRERNRLVDTNAELREDLRRAETELGLLRSGTHDTAASAGLRRENERLREQLLEWERRLRYVEDIEADKRRLTLETEGLKHRILMMIRRSLRGQQEIAQILATARAAVDETVLYFQEERSLQVDEWAEKNKNGRRRLGVFVDVQNMFYAARSQFHGRLDYECLLETLQRDRDVAIAVAYTIQTPDVDQSSFTSFLEHCGYTVKTKALRTRLDGSAKGDWDMEMALDIISFIGQLDVVTLVSGDGDFVPLVKLLKRHGIEVEIAAFRYNTAVDLRENADHYLPIGEELIIDQTSKTG